MIGTARKSIEADSTLITYDLLKAHLSKEYKDESSIIAIHDRLANKKIIRRTLAQTRARVRNVSIAMLSAMFLGIADARREREIPNPTEEIPQRMLF